MRMKLGGVTLDTGARELVRGAERLRLTPKAFQLLALLAENRPSAVSREDIENALWPEKLVTDANVTTLIKEIRHVLGDDARAPHLVRTVYGYGYALTPEGISPEPPGAGSAQVRHLVVVRDQEVLLREGDNVIGRDAEASIWLGDTSISRRHARIVVSGERVVLEDLDSKNGTFLGNQRISAPAVLASGDEIRIGDVPLRLVSVRIDGSTDSRV